MWEEEHQEDNWENDEQGTEKLQVRFNNGDQLIR